MVQISSWPTWICDGAHVLVTCTPGWNRLVLALACAIADTPIPAYRAVTVFSNGSGSPAITVRINVAGEHAPGANVASNEPLMLPRSVSMTEVRFTETGPVLQISMV